uniref:Uncharacterized protein n=1 Tax=Zosterops lateralis melanops TaxID=1220523 RepID=A0A8D2Q1H9_ZOSLA
HWWVTEVGTLQLSCRYTMHNSKRLIYLASVGRPDSVGLWPTETSPTIQKREFLLPFFFSGYTFSFFSFPTCSSPYFFFSSHFLCSFCPLPFLSSLRKWGEPFLEA